jgi:hypothetical protein
MRVKRFRGDALRLRGTIPERVVCGGNSAVVLASLPDSNEVNFFVDKTGGLAAY